MLVFPVSTWLAALWLPFLRLTHWIRTLIPRQQLSRRIMCIVSNRACISSQQNVVFIVSYSPMFLLVAATNRDITILFSKFLFVLSTRKCYVGMGGSCKMKIFGRNKSLAIKLRYGYVVTQQKWRQNFHKLFSYDAVLISMVYCLKAVCKVRLFKRAHEEGDVNPCIVILWTFP